MWSYLSFLLMLIRIVTVVAGRPGIPVITSTKFVSRNAVVEVHWTIENTLPAVTYYSIRYVNNICRPLELKVSTVSSYNNLYNNWCNK